MQQSQSNPVRGPIGLLAGWGDYPLVVADGLRRAGYLVCCLGVLGHADPRLAEVCHHFRWNGLARMGSAVRWFRRHDVTVATMAGKIHKVLLFQRWVWLRNLPDLRAIRMFLPHFLTRRKDCRDDSLLSTVVEGFASEGIRFVPATDFVPELLVRPGQLTSRGPTPAQQQDIAFGWRIAKQLGQLDIGQSVAVKNQAVLAVEAIEGTDQCIRRAGQLCPSGEFTVVKVAKPHQDMRFDVPTVGLLTLETMVAAGARVLAIEARRTIVLDEPAVRQFADRNRLVIVAVEDV